MRYGSNQTRVPVAALFIATLLRLGPAHAEDACVQTYQFDMPALGGGASLCVRLPSGERVGKCDVTPISPAQRHVLTIVTCLQDNGSLQVVQPAPVSCQGEDFIQYLGVEVLLTGNDPQALLSVRLEDRSDPARPVTVLEVPAIAVQPNAQPASISVCVPQQAPAEGSR